MAFGVADSSYYSPWHLEQGDCPLTGGRCGGSLGFDCSVQLVQLASLTLEV